MANNEIGSLIVNLGLETARLKSDTDKAARHFNSFEKRASRHLMGVQKRSLGLTNALTKLTGVAGILSVAGLSTLAKSALNGADEIQKLSIRLGASTEALSEYRHVAEISGVEFNTLTKGFQNMSDKISDAAKGTGEAAESLKQLNLDAAKLNQLNPDQQFEAIADAMQGVAIQGDKVRIAMDVFGGRGVSLIQAMEGGAAGIRELRGEAEALGLSLSRADADGAAAANDALARLKSTATSLSMTLGRELQGPIGNIADQLTAAALASGGFQTEIKSAIKVGLGSLATLVEATDSTVNFFDSREGLATAGVVGYLLFGKKGIAAVAAAQLVIDATAKSVVAMNRELAGPGLAVNTEEIVSARKRLLGLQEQYTLQIQMAEMSSQAQASVYNRLAKETLVLLNAEVKRVSGMELLTIGAAKMNTHWTESKSLLGEIAASLRQAQTSVDDITEKTRSGLMLNPHKGEKQNTNVALAPEPDLTDDKILRDRLGIQIETIENGLMTEEQRVFDSYARRQFIVEDAFENELISQERRQQLILQIEADFESQRTAIVQRGLSDRERFERLTTMNKVKFQLGSMAQMTQGVASNNRKLFELNKALALADAAVTLPDAVLKTYNNNGGYPWGVVPAGIMLATGLAQIQQIQSASFGGGGGGAASIAGSGGTPSNPVPQEPSGLDSVDSNRSGGIEIHVHGDILDKTGFREALVEALKIAEDNDEIRIVGSR